MVCRWPTTKFQAILLLYDDPHVPHIVAFAVAPRTIMTRRGDLREWRESGGISEGAFEEHGTGQKVVTGGTRCNEI
jgi:hypothetical protein